MMLAAVYSALGRPFQEQREAGPLAPYELWESADSELELDEVSTSLAQAILDTQKHPTHATPGEHSVGPRLDLRAQALLAVSCCTLVYHASTMRRACFRVVCTVCTRPCQPVWQDVGADPGDELLPEWTRLV